MPKPRSKYTDAFKRDAIRLVLDDRMPLTQAAAHLGVPNSVLSKWAKIGREATQAVMQSKPEPDLRQLAKRIELLEESLRVLRKIIQEDLTNRVKAEFPG
jgi:transposase-like protein